MPDSLYERLCSHPECEDPRDADAVEWCDWHGDLLRDHRRLEEAPLPGNDFFHRRDSRACPACSLGADPRKGLCRAPLCDERRAEDEEDEEYAAWRSSHGGLLLDHRIDELEGTDNHYHPQDREDCPACKGWTEP